MQSKNDHYVNLADQAVRGLSESIAHGSFLVDFAPILSYIPCVFLSIPLWSHYLIPCYSAWFPGATFKKKAELWANDSKEIVEGPWVDLKKSYVRSLNLPPSRDFTHKFVQENGTSAPCFATYSLDKFKYSEHMEQVIKNCSGVAFVGKLARNIFIAFRSLTPTSPIASWCRYGKHFQNQTKPRLPPDTDMQLFNHSSTHKTHKTIQQTHPTPQNPHKKTVSTISSAILL